ncbi:MAG: pyridoxine 5'-phosphate synthase [Pirellulales bacterium]|nr:pyridoxine 5'-phosphate synthase [Pirellulales bacterium]MBL7193150.1 pyridoxine 5'-phosphate synthase [Pirellulales bacterium]
MVQLGVNIDHVAIVRQARYRDFGPDLGEPDTVRAAHEAELGGADGITVHLREDRRHIQDRCVELLRRLIKVRLNLEMAATPKMIGIAGRIVPHTVMLVPEDRAEVTTERGLDVAGEAEAEHPALEIATKLVLNVCRHGPLGVSPLKPALEVLGDDLVERRLLGPATLVAAGRRGTAVRAASALRRKPCDRGDHGRTGRWTA